MERTVQTNKITLNKLPERSEGISCGLYLWQLKLVVRIHDGGDIFCRIATGGGKSALFSVPIIILEEVARRPNLYPDLPVRLLPVRLVITPTKGLAANIVLELKKLNVPAFPYCHETVTEAHIAGRNLVHDIRNCKTWNIICVDPDHLREKAWRQISAFDVFRANIVYGCADEAHLINTWGTEFHPKFGHIGAATTRECSRSGEAERVCLVGDVAHALPPNGQGSTMAFEDAAYLARLLAAHSLDAPRDVARLRIERVHTLAHGTGGAKGGTATGWKYMLKKWGMVAYFAWNGYELQDERILGYDVTKEEVGVPHNQVLVLVLACEAL
ncbi:hypothetical protein DFH08DRAFT_1027774 [Mycena albidolilacea]|uniref:FAD-binding domain-containing protein n=1 Tax=Mycena albidolilacea TaxID=1033008 RepID=A0AAD6ZJ40_9AGAR|nr:hypothetical protein DFH08DRAFT_1027774 [Mycena albidolilacea]